MSDIIHDPPTKQHPSFEQIHARGTQEFGFAWLKTNEDIVSWCHTMGFNVNTPLHKKVISLLVLRAMYRGRQALKDQQKRSRRPRFNIAGFGDSGVWMNAFFYKAKGVRVERAARRFVRSIST